MGQELSSTKLKIPDLLTPNTQHFNGILSDNRIEDVFLFLPLEVINELSKITISSSDQDKNQSIELPITKQTLSKHIRNNISLLTKSSALQEYNTEINELIVKVFEHISLRNTNLQSALQLIGEQQEKLKNSYAEKLKDDENIITSIFSQTFSESLNSNENQTDNDTTRQARLHKFQAEQLSFFAVQSLISMLLILLKSVHQYDSTIVHHMLNLTNQLVEQIPLNYLSPDVYKRSSGLFKSLRPLTNYINDLSIQTDLDSIAANQSMKILLKFSVIKGSLKDVLALVRKLLFNTMDIYDIRTIFIELNKDLTSIAEQFQKQATTSGNTSNDANNTESTVSIDKILDMKGSLLATLEYLKSMEVYPTTQLLTLHENKFTGQFVSLVLLAHVDVHNQLHGKSQFDRCSVYGSFSFEFEPETFKILYEIIEQSMAMSSSMPHFEYMIDVCLRLFTTHLQFLIAAKVDNFHTFLNEKEMEKWSTFILKLVSDDSSEERKKHAAKTLILLMEKHNSSLSNTLSTFHTELLENKHPILIAQFFDVLSKDVFIYKWIEYLCDNNSGEEKILATKTLHSFIDIALKLSSMDADKVNRIHDIIFKFQELIFVYLNNQPPDTSNELESLNISTVVIEYSTHVIRCCLKDDIKSDLFEPLLFGLCALTDAKFNFAVLQPIFTNLIPLFAEYLLKTSNVDMSHNYLITWLVGQMSNRLIIGPPQSPLEKKYNTTLKLPLFSGGYEAFTTENNSYLSNLFKSDLAVYSRFIIPYRRQQSVLNNEFLLSIYNNTAQGAQLITKMKTFIRDKQRILQKSIESDANDACAAIFAVYIKHYRRIELAQHELSHPIDQRPHGKLLLLYEWANQVRSVFSTTKARGGDCHALYKRIKNDALLLLTSVKESSFIPTIKDFALSVLTVSQQHKFQRQISRWTKAKHILRLLRHALNACIRLKYLMLEKRQAIDQKKDCESVLHRAIATCLYGSYTSTSVVNGELTIESDEVVKCLIRQYQRAMTRLITYQFLNQFIGQLLNIKDNNNNNNQVLNILLMILSNAKDNNLDWHYLDNIQASNNKLKKYIGQWYYTIIKKVISFSKESTSDLNIKTVYVYSLFNLMNLSYDLIDLSHLNDFQYIQELFDLFVSFIEINSPNKFSINVKLTSFNWFRLLVFKLCENIEMEELRTTSQLGNRKSHHALLKQRDLIFNKLILSELKQLQEKITTFENESQNLSLTNIAIDYFIKQNTSTESTTLENINGCINQYLILLLRCFHLYEHVRLTYATMDYAQQLFSLYQQTQLLNTRLLILKIFRDLLIFLPENNNETTTQTFIENLLNDYLFSIGQHINMFETSEINQNIIIEFIYIYRTLIIQCSPWQKLAIKSIIDAIQLSLHFNLSSLESIDTRQMNFFLGALCILGGYIPPYCLGSTVEIYANNKSINELESATIIQIDTNILESDSNDAKPYFVQYASTNHSEWVSPNQLRIIIDVQPPNISFLQIDNGIDVILDTLGYLAQINTSNIESLMLLQIKRRAIIAFYPLLNSKAIIDIFMKKSYASIIAKLSISVDNIVSNGSTQANDLRLFNRLHLEQYDLSLNKCERTKQIIDDAPDDVRNTNGWNQMKINRDPNVLQYVSKGDSIEQDWQPVLSKAAIQSYKRGRIGNDDFIIVPFPPNDALPPLEECGTKHKFKGRINITDDAGNIRYPTFIADGIQLTEGKWYFCVKILLGGAVQIGWATNGFNPIPDNSKGVGEDQYSWGYDGSRGICYHNSSTSFADSIRWKAEDVCGCGIEIDGENTTIKYWLNGDFLGTAFSHSTNTTITSIIKTDLLPNGLGSTTYFPSATVQVYSSIANTGAIEFIFSPEDMTQCPLPKDYKPILMPKLATIDNVLVAYPYSAYLVGNKNDAYFYTSRNSKNDSTDNNLSVLRDFVNDHHLEVPFNKERMDSTHDYLNFSEENDGFPLSIDNSKTLTISIDFDIILTDNSENPPEQLDVILFSFNDEMFSIKILMNDINDDFVDESMTQRQRVAIVFQTNEQTKVYINNNYQTLNYCHSFDQTTKSKLNLRLLPYVNVGIKNIGIWQYALSEEHIRRLFTYSLSYVAMDYQKLNEYRQRTNTLSFNVDQTHFMNEILIPFNETFEESLWETRKSHITDNESHYFKSIIENQRSVVQLFGNKTYLVLSTANQVWSEYTLVLDICLPCLTSKNKTQLTLMTLDAESEIYITHDGHIGISPEHQSSSIVKLQEYIRLLISIQSQCVNIYVNGTLELNAPTKENQFATKAKRIDLFREINSTKNTTNNNHLRIECQSITFWNKSIDLLNPLIAKSIKSPKIPLEKLVAPSYSILSTTLTGIGYKEESIKYVMEKFNTTNIYFIDNILREKSHEVENAYLQEQQKKKINVLTRLNSYDEQGTLAILMKFDNEIVSTFPNDTPTEIVGDDSEAASSSEKEWFRKSIHHFGIQSTLTDWIRDKSRLLVATIEDSRYKLVDLTKIDSDETTSDNGSRKKMNKSLHYVHRQIPRKVYLNGRKTCEYGLITIYARYTILNMLKVWSQEDHANLFPIEKFGDVTFIVTLLRLMDYHYTCSRTHVDETSNWMKLLTMSILKVELKTLLKCVINEQIKDDILNTKAPLLCQLQKHVIEESIRFLSEPSVIDINNYDNEIIDEHMLIKQSNSDFLLKIISMFLEFFTDSEMKKYDVDQLIRLLFPTVLIRVLFDLFLLLPSHRSKIFILNLYNTLIRASENFKLHSDIQNFILQLFIELTTNTAYLNNLGLKNFRNAVIDLGFALFERQKRLILDLNECSSHAHDLWTIIDVINILMKNEKKSEWPEQFIKQSESILGDKLQLTKEIIDTAQVYFDTAADEQLMQFLNVNINLEWNPLPHDSLNEFIHNLPTESVPNLIKYKSYGCLCNIPAVHIQTRAKCFYLFNILLEKLFSMIDFEFAPNANSVADRIRAARNYILFTSKFQSFSDSLNKTTDCSVSAPDVRFDTVKSSTGERVEDTMFYQAYQQVRENASFIFRKSNDERVWSATFVGMHSTDAGGPYRDSLTRICEDICSTRLQLFILCPNGRTNSGLNRDRWIPNVFPPNRPIPDEFKNQYRFVGQLMGMAIRTRNLLDLRFPTLLWKQLVQEPVTIEDIEAIDMQSFTIINQMEENIKQIKAPNDFEDGSDLNNNCDYLFSSIMSELTFDVVSSAGQTYELIPGGYHTSINAANFEDYCMRYRQYRINEFRRQIDFIRQGFCSVVPLAYLTLYTAKELEEAVCGKGVIDIDLLKRHTNYSSDSETEPYIERFWTVLRDMFTEEQKKLFLIFAWGRSTLPNRDSEFSTNFTINRLDTNGNVDQALPKSHTCYFSIDLPRYSTKEIMYERLNYAITYCSSIDNDGNLN